MRKTPIQHTVKSHTRQGKPVKTYQRGSGTKRQPTRRVVKSRSVIISSGDSSRALIKKMKSVGGKFLGRVYWFDRNEVNDVTEEMYNTEGERDFYDVELGNWGSIWSVPKGIKVEGPNVEKLRADDMEDKIEVEELTYKY